MPTNPRQTQISNSITIDDTLSLPSYSDVTTLEGDLNYLRSVIRDLKGTANYDSPLAASLESLYNTLQSSEFHDAVLTGTPTATEAIPEDDFSERLATTRFVRETVDSTVSSAGLDARFVHTQNATAPVIWIDNVKYWVWTVTHNLGKFPSVTVVNSANQVVIGLVEYLDATNQVSTDELRIYLTSGEIGKAYLN